MNNNLRLLLGAILIAIFIAGLPSDAINENYITVGQPPNASVAISVGTGYIGTGYTLNNLPIMRLSGANPTIFSNVAFAKEPGGLSSGSQYTSSINSFLKGERDAGISKIAKKPLKLGLMVVSGQNNSSDVKQLGNISKNLNSSSGKE